MDLLRVSVSFFADGVHPYDSDVFSSRFYHRGMGRGSLLKDPKPIVLVHDCTLGEPQDAFWSRILSIQSSKKACLRSLQRRLCTRVPSRNLLNVNCTIDQSGETFDSWGIVHLHLRWNRRSALQEFISVEFAY